tara:strand:- start:305 stop:481 length:177 start_codon:yes stop_codon:yes gene_type:complete
MEEIKIPICYVIDDETGEKVYDFEEMANALEENINKLLKRDVLVTISELRDEYESEEE